MWREDVVAYCAALALLTLDDPSNADPRFLRSRVRHELIPALEAVFPAARRRLCVLADHQRRLVDPSSPVRYAVPDLVAGTVQQLSTEPRHGGRTQTLW